MIRIVIEKFIIKLSNLLLKVWNVENNKIMTKKNKTTENTEEKSKFFSSFGLHQIYFQFFMLYNYSACCAQIDIPLKAVYLLAEVQ